MHARALTPDQKEIAFGHSHHSSFRSFCSDTVFAGISSAKIIGLNCFAFRGLHHECRDLNFFLLYPFVLVSVANRHARQDSHQLPNDYISDSHANRAYRSMSKCAEQSVSNCCPCPKSKRGLVHSCVSPGCWLQN